MAGIQVAIESQINHNLAKRQSYGLSHTNQRIRTSVHAGLVARPRWRSSFSTAISIVPIHSVSGGIWIFGLVISAHRIAASVVRMTADATIPVARSFTNSSNVFAVEVYDIVPWLLSIQICRGSGRINLIASTTDRSCSAPNSMTYCDMILNSRRNGLWLVDADTRNRPVNTS